MPTLRLSARALTDFQVCPLRHGLAAQAGAPPLQLAPSPALSVGNSLHAALRALYAPGRPAPVPTEPAAIEAVLRQHWVAAGFESADQQAEWFAQAREALLALVWELGPPAGEVLATEANLWARFSQDGLHFVLAGRVDRIDRLPDGSLELLDYKAHPAGRVIAPEALAADLGMFAYYVLARQRYPQHPRVLVAQLNVFSRLRSVVEYTPDQRTANKARLLQAVAEIAAGRLVPNPGPWCGWCAVRDRCPAFQPEARWDDV